MELKLTKEEIKKRKEDLKGLFQRVEDEMKKAEEMANRHKTHLIKLQGKFQMLNEMEREITSKEIRLELDKRASKVGLPSGSSLKDIEHAEKKKSKKDGEE